MKKSFVSKWHLVCCLALLFSLSACSLFRSVEPRMQYLIGGTKSQKSAPSNAPELHIRPIHVSTPFAGQEFVYRTDENTFESDYYNGFFVTPGDMFTEAARHSLFDGLFVPAAQFNRSAKPQYVLEGWVDAIYGDFRDTQHPKAVLEMRFSLFKSGGPEMLWMNRYRMEVPLKSRSPDGLVEAWNSAWHSISSRLRSELRAKTR